MKHNPKHSKSILLNKLSVIGHLFVKCSCGSLEFYTWTGIYIVRWKMAAGEILKHCCQVHRPCSPLSRQAGDAAQKKHEVRLQRIPINEEYTLRFLHMSKC